MVPAQLFPGAFLFVLLVVAVCCYPVKKGINPGASHGGTYVNTAPNYGSEQAAPYEQFSPGVSSGSVSSPSYPRVPHMKPTFSQPAVRMLPAPGSGPSAYAFLPDRSWLVEPPSFLSKREEPVEVASRRSETVSPPQPMYHAGELSYYEGSNEHGGYEGETEEQGYMPHPPPPPPMRESAGHYTSGSHQPVFRGFGSDPYFYYDYMFLTGQYPPGTVTHSSSSYEQGSDGWQDGHYVRYHAPYYPGPVQKKVTFTIASAAPQKFEPQGNQ